MDEIAEVVAYAERLNAAGQGEQARRLCRRLACVFPDSITAWSGLAVYAAEPGPLSRAAVLDPQGIGGDVATRRALAQAFTAAGRPDKADRQLCVWAALAPDDVDAHFTLALRRHLAADPQGAAAPFQRAAALRPDLPAAQLNAGSSLFDSGRWREAVGYFRRTLALAPHHAYALFQLGRCRRRLADVEDAFRLVERARRLEGPRGDFDAELAHISKERGDWAAALRLGRRLVLDDPGGYDPWFAVGVAAEHQHDEDAALAAYGRAIRANPAFGEAFTRRAATLLRRRLGPPPRPRPAATRREKRLGATQLGVNGRFGNQVLQYGFLRAYAAAHGLTLETPEWVGRYLFDADDPPPGPPLPRVREEEGNFMDSLNSADGGAYAGHDLIGFFCGDTSPMAPHRQTFQAAFRLGDRVAEHAGRLEAALRRSGGQVVALHLRRGDFGWGRFWIAPVEWYLDWLAMIWPRLDAPTLYVASDEPALAAAFSAYAPLTAADLGPLLPGAEFFNDFHALRCADVLAVSNSSFSFSAAMLNEKAMVKMRPDRRVGGLKPFDPWRSPVLLD